MKHAESSKHARRVFTSLARINSFSDAVFAVAITLLVLSIAVPTIKGAHTNANLWRGLHDIFGHFLAYVLSFLIIGAFWYRHHDLFDRLERYDSRMVRLNTVLLMFVVFIPYPTSLIGRYGDISLAVAIYGVTMAVSCLLMTSICLYAAKGRRLVGEDFDYEFAYGFTVGYVSTALVFFVSTGIAFINAPAGLYFLMILVILSPLLDRLRPFRSRFIRWVSATGEKTAEARREAKPTD
jgi:uncharacterized membrane protein